MNNFYTGVGSRSTPSDVRDIMTQLATNLAAIGYTLRSGGAKGADTAFEQGAPADQREIYVAQDATEAAMAIAAKFHPAWHRCGSYARMLHARNAFQVLGRDLSTPSRFLLCWTPDGCFKHEQRQYSTGGTGTAISIADHYNVPVFNLAHKSHFDRVLTLLSA